MNENKEIKDVIKILKIRLVLQVKLLKDTILFFILISMFSEILIYIVIQVPNNTKSYFSFNYIDVKSSKKTM